MALRSLRILYIFVLRTKVVGFPVRKTKVYNIRKLCSAIFFLIYNISLSHTTSLICIFLAAIKDFAHFFVDQNLV